MTTPKQIRKESELDVRSFDFGINDGYMVFGVMHDSGFIQSTPLRFATDQVIAKFAISVVDASRRAEGDFEEIDLEIAKQALLVKMTLEKLDPDSLISTKR